MPRQRKQYRPRYLIIVTEADGPRLFSAHHTEDAARAMLTSLDGLTAAQVTLIEVPETDGIVPAPRRAKPAPASASPATTPRATAPAAASPAPARPAYRERTPEELDAITANALAAGGSQIISSAILDGPEPIS